MVAFSSMSESKFLKKEDLDPERGNLCHITKFVKQKVDEDQDTGMTEFKWTMYVREFEKPMVLNATNRSILERIYGKDTDDCIGKPIVLYVDENVSYAGKLVGGIRLRAPRQRAAEPVAPAPPPKAVHVDQLDDDIPF